MNNQGRTHINRFLTLSAFSLGLLASGAVYAAERTVTLAVANMTCASCPYIVEKSLSAVPGVSKVTVSFEDKSAVATFDDQKTNVQTLIDSVTTAGYPSKLAAAPTMKTQ